MKKSQTTWLSMLLFIFAVLAVFCASSFAQGFGRNPTPNDTLVSTRILADNKIQFSVYAPKAEAVLLSGTDIPNNMAGAAMTKAENGVWRVVVGPVVPGAYRYNFNVDGVSVIDPRNPTTSESNENTWSLVYVPGSEAFDTKDVPHGAIAEVTYYSKSLKRFRRMHVYTPPGYESGSGTYPIFYLLHGAFDCDDSWSTVGRAGFILDNLIATKKAVPMVVVMPAGHTGPFRFGDPLPVDEFIRDFQNDIKPYAEMHYRVKTDRKSRAIAGLSMGGAQTLDISIANLKDYAYIGVYSSGVFGIDGRGPAGAHGGTWEARNKATLDNAALKNGLKLIWFATGKDDFLVETSRATVKALKNHGFNVIYKESAGGHTWINWRDYLGVFAQQLFK